MWGSLSVPSDEFLFVDILYFKWRRGLLLYFIFNFIRSYLLLLFQVLQIVLHTRLPNKRLVDVSGYHVEVYASLPLSAFFVVEVSFVYLSVQMTESILFKSVKLEENI